MLWPDSRLGSSGSCAALPPMPSTSEPASATPVATRITFEVTALPRRGRCHRLLGLALLDLHLVILVAQIGDVHPCVRHLIDGPVAPANPLTRIRIGFVARRVVVPRRDAQDGAFRKERG